MQMMPPFVSDSGTRTICKALARNSYVTRLDLTYNFICNYGADYAATFLGTNATLRQLLLRGNCIGDRGAGA